jgi:hypothetical protein
VDAFHAVGLGASAIVTPPSRGIGDIPWLVLAALPVQAFLNKMGEELAAGAYQRLKVFVRDVLGAGGKATTAHNQLVLQDTNTNVQVVLEADLAAEAYRQLLRLDLSRFGPGPLQYDRHLERWQSSPDELERRVPRTRGEAGGREA